MKKDNKSRGRPSTGHTIIHEVCQSLGYTQQQMAEWLGVTKAAVSRYATGQRQLNDREHKYIVLVLAKRIDQKRRSAELQQWIDEVEKEFETRPLGAVIL